MTYYWKIKGTGTTNQTLMVYDDNMNAVETFESDSFSWSNDYPQQVYDVVVDHDVKTALKEDIERVKE